MSRVPSLSSPFLLGFDEIERALDRVAKAADGYPPYNIERVPRENGKPERLRITLAVAGFNRDQLDVTVEESQLLIRGRQQDDKTRQYLHRGIAARQFQRSFVLAEGIEIRGAWLDNGLLHIGISWFPSSVEQIFGWLFSPIAWVIGIPWQDCHTIGNLLGLRMVTNELVAFQRLGPMKDALDPRSFTIATFALCGFANLGSIGMQIGGIGALAPNQKSQLAKFGIRAMLAGTMANLMSASIVGMFLK